MHKIRATSWSNVWSSKCCDFLVENALWMCGEAIPWFWPEMNSPPSGKVALQCPTVSANLQPSSFTHCAMAEEADIAHDEALNSRQCASWDLRFHIFWDGMPCSEIPKSASSTMSGCTTRCLKVEVYIILYTSPTSWPMFCVVGDRDDVAEYSCWMLLVECCFFSRNTLIKISYINRDKNCNRVQRNR